MDLGVRTSRRAAVLSALLMAACAVAASWTASATHAAPAPARPTVATASGTGTATERTGLGISAFFVLPAPTVAANERQLREMGADAITFGHRVEPAARSSFPSEVQRLIGSRTPYAYAGGLSWRPSALRPGDEQVRICWVTWTVTDTGRGTVVVSSDADDRQGALVRAGNALGAKTILGLPAPRAGSQDGVAYLPDTSYLPTLAAFTQRFVVEARAEGADGFYQHVEMPVTDTRTWNPVRQLYASQNAAVSRAWPRALVVLSPYLEARRDKAFVTPEQAARGATMLAATASGTRLVLAPQDGLGTGTTALASDSSTAAGHVAPLESYLRAMRAAVGTRLWVNVELMRPTPGGAPGAREATTRSRVLEQLAAEQPHVSGAIAFIWDDRTRDIGAVQVVDGMAGLSDGFGTTGH
ncbi:hypothetical protein [Terrabacter aeriphilus]|uniref:hypothetical protein n=1 Tax=Terrabacter aeriphilus TaxID=515662 RepID=UPI0031E9F63A